SVMCCSITEFGGGVVDGAQWGQPPHHLTTWFLRRLRHRQFGVGGRGVNPERASQREPQREQAPHADLALGADVAAVLAQYLPAYSQPEAGALRPLGADERAEDLAQFLRRDARAGVADPNADELTTRGVQRRLSSGPHQNPALSRARIALLHSVDRVGDDVQ